MRTLKVDIKPIKDSHDYMVNVRIGDGAPQLFTNLPWKVCANRCGANEDEIEAAEVTRINVES